MTTNQTRIAHTLVAALIYLPLLAMACAGAAERPALSWENRDLGCMTDSECEATDGQPVDLGSVR